VSPTSSDRLDLPGEVLRINARYLREFVEAFDVCPFATAAREAGQVERRVLLAESPAAADVVAAVREIETHASAVIGLLIFPRFAGGFEAFDALAAAARTERGGDCPFAFAPFHPDAPYGTQTPAQMVMFFRRAPDPTLQLVRFDALDQVKGARPDKMLFDFSAAAWAELERRDRTPALSERIARDNFARARSAFERLRAVLDDIRADRLRSY
jgi:hypothetical protein